MYTTASGQELDVNQAFQNFIKHFKFEDLLRSKIENGNFDMLEDYMKEAKKREAMELLKENLMKKIRTKNEMYQKF